MGSIAKYHSRHTLSKNEAVKFKYQDNYVDHATCAELRVRSYKSHVKKQAQIEEKRKKEREEEKGFLIEEEEMRLKSKQNKSNSRSLIQDPSKLAKKRAILYKRKQAKNKRSSIYEGSKKWYHSDSRPKPVIGDIENVKRRAKIAMQRIKDERERKKKMEKIKYKEQDFKKKLLTSEAQRIVSNNVGKFEKGSYILRSSKPSSSSSYFYTEKKPAWNPTGYYNEVEYTKNTKKVNESFVNKPGILRTFSYP